MIQLLLVFTLSYLTQTNGGVVFFKSSDFVKKVSSEIEESNFLSPSVKVKHAKNKNTKNKPFEKYKLIAEKSKNTAN